MKAIQRSTPSIIGWIAYYAYKTALSLILVWAVYLLSLRLFPVPPSPLFYILSLCISALSGFLGFAASAKWIVLPLIQRTRTISEVPTLPTLFVEWLWLCIRVVLFGRLPLFFLTMVFSIPDSTRDMISSLWIAFVSFLVYLYSFSGYTRVSGGEPVDDENHTLEVA